MLETLTQETILRESPRGWRIEFHQQQTKRWLSRLEMLHSPALLGPR